MMRKPVSIFSAFQKLHSTHVPVTVAQIQNASLIENSISPLVVAIDYFTSLAFLSLYLSLGTLQLYPHCVVDYYPLDSKLFGSPCASRLSSYPFLSLHH